MGGENRGHGSIEISASVATENMSLTDRVETSQMLSSINPEASEKHKSISQKLARAVSHVTFRITSLKRRWLSGRRSGRTLDISAGVTEETIKRLQIRGCLPESCHSQV